MEATNKRTGLPSFNKLILLSLATLALTACGGGGGGGNGGGTVDGVVLGGPDFNSDQATITSLAEAVTMAEASRQGSTQAIFAQDGLSIPQAAEVETSGASEFAAAHAVALAVASRTAAGVESEPVAGDCGGTATADSPNADGNRLIITYDDYCTHADESETELTIDGKADITFNPNNSEAYNALFDFTITFEGKTYINQGQLSCNGASPNVCGYTLNFTGTNNVIYKISNATVTSDGSTGFNVTARIFEQSLGFVDFTTTNLTQCTEGGYDSGSISLEDSNGPGSVEVTFSGCGNYLVEFGVENTMSPQP